MVPARGCSSVSNGFGSPFFWGMGTATISALKRPSRIAASARAWLSAAKASCSARPIEYRSATFSAVIPMWMSWKASVRPSWIMWSSTLPWPRRSPQRAPGRRKGARLMLSVPPATISSASPQRMACAASITAFRPEPQTLLTVVAGTESGSPALIAACRAGFMPSPACRMQPRITSSTWSGRMPARRTASRTATVASSTALTSLSAPPKVPTGVRQPETMTTSVELIVGPPGDRSAGRAGGPRRSEGRSPCRCGRGRRRMSPRTGS